MKKLPEQLIYEWLGACSPRWIFSILAVFGFLVYAGAVFLPFVHDDIFFLVENPSLRSFSFRENFFHALDMGVFGSSVNAYYRPLLNLVNHWQYLVFGLDSRGFHLFNISLHIINAFLVYSLFFRILDICPGITRERGRWTALITAVVFLVHPVQTQAVDCVSGVSNLLFAFFGLSAFIFYFESRRQEKIRRALFLYSLSLMTLTLALLSKEQAMVFPFLIFWFEIYFSGFSRSVDRRKTVLRVAGWMGLIIAYLAFRKFFLGSMPLLDEHFFDKEFWLRISAIPGILLTNVGLVFFPADLHYFRSINVTASPVSSFILLTGLLAAGTMIVRRMPHALRRLTLFGLGWFLLAQMMTINILPLIWEYSYISTAEHFLYLPMIGIVLPATALFLEYCPSVFNGQLKAAVLIVIIAVLSIVTIGQHAHWRSEGALFERVARFEPDLGRVRMLLGRARHAEGRFADAVKEYSAAHDRMSFYEQAAFGEKSKRFYRLMRKDIDRGMAVSYQALGDMASAEKYFLEALRIAPDDSEVHNDIGVLHAVTHRNGLALHHFRRAFELEPHNELFIKNYALALAVAGQKNYALRLVQKTLSGRLSGPDMDMLLNGIQNVSP